MAEVVGMLVLQDMDLPAKEFVFSLLFAEINGHVVVELPQARSFSSGVGSIKRRHTTINCGDGEQVRMCFGGDVSSG